MQEEFQGQREFLRQNCSSGMHRGMSSFEETSCLPSLIFLSVLDACLCLHVSGIKDVCVWVCFGFG